MSEMEHTSELAKEFLNISHKQCDYFPEQESNLPIKTDGIWEACKKGLGDKKT